VQRLQPRQRDGLGAWQRLPRPILDALTREQRPATIRFAPFQGSSAPCTGAGGSRLPGIVGNRLFSPGSGFAGRRIALRFAAVLGHIRVRRVDS
jgi:hypothetical protein